MEDEREEIATDETMLRKGGGNQLVFSIRKGLAKIKAIQDAKGKVLKVDLVREHGTIKLVIDLGPRHEVQT